MSTDESVGNEMSDSAIREIARDEILDILDQEGLTEADIIVAREPLTEGMVARRGLGAMTVVKRARNFLIVVARRAGRAVAVVVYVLGVYQAAQLAGVLLVGRTLPDALELASLVRTRGIELAQELGRDQEDQPAKLAALPPSWAAASEEEYVTWATGVTSGQTSTDDVLSTGSEFVAVSGVPPTTARGLTSSADAIVLSGTTTPPPGDATV